MLALLFLTRLKTLIAFIEVRSGLRTWGGNRVCSEVEAGDSAPKEDGGRSVVGVSKEMPFWALPSDVEIAWCVWIVCVGFL